MYLLINQFNVHIVSYSENNMWAKGVGHKSDQNKTGSVTYSMNCKKEVSKILIIYLGSNRGGRYQFKQTFESSGLYSLFIA